MENTPTRAETHTPRGATDRPALLTVCDGIEEMEPLVTAKINDYVHFGNIRSSITVRCILCIEFS
jgi:hypothetical protein